jgi:hypothetical protein
MENKEFEKMPPNSFTLTKRISKHGSQSVIIVPRILQEKLKPGTVAEIRIEILETDRSS